jgi:hypothetical protein
MRFWHNMNTLTTSIMLYALLGNYSFVVPKKWSLTYVVFLQHCFPCCSLIRSPTFQDRQYNDQKKKDKKATKDPQNTTQKTKDWTTWYPKKNLWLLHVLEGVSSYISTSGTCHVTLSSFYLLNSTKCIQYITCKIAVKTGTDTKQMKDWIRLKQTWGRYYWLTENNMGCYL